MNRFARVAVCSIAFAAAVAPLSAEGPLEVLQEDLRVLGNQIKNAKAKMQHVSGGQGHGGAAITRSRSAPNQSAPMENCCSQNIRSITARLNSVGTVLQSLHAEHEAENDAAGMASVAHLAEALRDARRYFEMAKGVNDSDSGVKVLKKLSSAAVHLRQAVEDYKACCVDAAAVEEPPKQKREKKKKKKKA